MPMKKRQQKSSIVDLLPPSKKKKAQVVDTLVLSDDENGDSPSDVIVIEDSPGRVEQTEVTRKSYDTEKEDPEVLDQETKASTDIPYSVLVDAMVQMSATKSRLLILRILTDLFKTVIKTDKKALTPVYYLLLSKIKPSFASNSDLGIGSQVLMKALKETSGLSTQTLRKLFHKHGDPGDVALEALQSVRLLSRPKPLVCHTLYDKLCEMSKLKGPGSLGIKTNMVKKMLIAAHGEEIRYLTRTLIQNLRIGVMNSSLIVALGRAFSGSSDSDSIMKQMWAKHPYIDSIISALLEGGIEHLEQYLRVSIGIPIQPMLGSITRSFDDVFVRLHGSRFVSEAKLDGQRVQVHASRNGPQLEADKDILGYGRWITLESGASRVYVRLFSRHLDDMTEKYPDICQTVALIFKQLEGSLDDMILDAEVVAVDSATGALKTFQELSARDKKDVSLSEVKVQICVFVFDIMHLNGESLLPKPFYERRAHLRSLFLTTQVHDPRFARWELIPSSEATDPEGIEAFFRECVAKHAEGIMVKALDEAIEETPDGEESTKHRRLKAIPATYEPDKRTNAWLKVKKDYLDTAGDSLDLVPIGAWHGMGRKSKWWSPILLACYNTESGTHTAVCKCMSGFSDEFYQDLRARYPPVEECITDETLGQTSYEKYPNVESGELVPDIWFNPSEVWEIKGADLTLSPVYTAAEGLVSERGISLRFPRFIRIRDKSDKGVEDATSHFQLADMYAKQSL